MRFLLQKNTHIYNLRFCHELLCQFVDHSALLYGKRFVSYNVHSVIHAVDDHWHFGSLEIINSFVFESYLGLLKNCVRSGYKPLQQVARHAYHCNRMCAFITNSINEYSTISKTDSGGAVISENGSSQLVVKKLVLSNPCCILTLIRTSVDFCQH